MAEQRVREVRLYRGTDPGAVPQDFEDVTHAALRGAAPGGDGDDDGDGDGDDAGIERYLASGAVVTAGGLSDLTTYHFWLEVVHDVGGGGPGPVPIGSHTTPALRSIVPTLTSANSAGCSVTWSSAWRDDQTGWRAFDGRNVADGSGWASARWAADGSPEWLAVELPAPDTAVRFRLWSNEVWHDNGNALWAFEVQGCNDGPWVTLGAYSGATYAAVTPAQRAGNPKFQADLTATDDGNAYLFDAALDSPGAYKHYRIVSHAASNGGVHVSAGEWVLLGRQQQ